MFGLGNVLGNLYHGVTNAVGSFLHLPQPKPQQPQPQQQQPNLGQFLQQHLGQAAQQGLQAEHQVAHNVVRSINPVIKSIQGTPIPGLKNYNVGNAYNDFVQKPIIDPAVQGGRQLSAISTATNPMLSAKQRSQAPKVDLAKFAGNAAITGLNAATMGKGSIVAHGAETALGKLGQAALENAAVGGLFGGAHTLSQGGTPADYAKNIGAGALAGGALGAGGHLAESGGKVALKGIRIAGNKTAQIAKSAAPYALNENGFIAGNKAAGFGDAVASGRTYLGADNKPRFEGSDAGMKVKPDALKNINNGQKETLGGVIHHPELFKQYPELKGVGVVSDPSIPTPSHYNEHTDTIHLNPDKLPDGASLRSALVHENQHAIQATNNLARGGVPGPTDPAAVDPSKPLIATQKALKQATAAKDAIDKQYGESVSRLDRNSPEFANQLKAAQATVRSPEYKALSDKVNGLSQQHQTLLTEARNNPAKIAQANRYGNLTGEAEANAAVSREHMTQKEMNANPVDANYDKNRLDMVNSTRPTVAAMADNGVKDTKSYLSELKAAQNDARNGPKLKLSSKIGNFFDEVKTKLIDSNAPIEDLLHYAQERGAKVAPKDNITYQIDKTLRAPTLAGQFAKDNGLVDVIKKAPDLHELNQYMIAKHSADLAVKEIKTGRNNPADAALVKQLAPKYEAHAQVVNKYSQKLLDYAVSKGLVSKELATHLKAEYPNYVPINRIFSDGELPNAKGNGAGVASNSGQSIIQRLKGSARVIENPLESLLSKTNDAFMQGERNDAARILAGYEKLPGNPFELKELKPTEAIGNKNVISYLDKGTKRVFQTTPEIAAAAKSLNKEQLGLVGKILSIPTRILRLGATGINLPFVASNIVKDQVTAFVNSDHAAATSLANPGNFLRALANAVGNGKEYENMVRNAAGGTSFDIGRDAAPKTIKQIRASRNAGSNILYTVTHPSQLLRAVEDTIGKSESVGRIQQFTGTRDALLKEGHSPEDANLLAAHAARNNTTNFARSGDYGRVLNSVLPYLNAGIQGSRTLMRNLHTRPVQTGAKLALTTFAPIAAVTAWNLSDPQRKAAYDNIQASEKGANLIIVPPNPTQDAKGRWNVIKIPLSQEVANLGDIVRNGVEAMSNDTSFNFKAMVGSLLGTATSINVQDPRQALGQVIPQALKPAIEAMTNTNLYTGNQIVPQGLQNYPTSMQYQPNTSGTAVKVGQALGVSPLQVQNAVGTAAGGVGRQLLNVSDRALAAAGKIQPSQIGGQDALDTTTAKFTKANGISQSQKDYLAKQAAAKAKAAQGAPKKLVQAGLAGDPSLKGLDPKTQTRLQNASTKVNPKAPKSAQDALMNFAKLDAAGKKAYLADPKNKQALAQAKYDNAKAAGSLSGVKDYKAQTSLAKQGVTSNFSQDVQDFYALSKAQQNEYIKANPTVGKDLYNQARQLDSALGGSKYKYGLGTKPKAPKRAKALKVAAMARPTKLPVAARVKVPKLASFTRTKTLKAPKITAPKLASTSKKMKLTA